MALTASAFRWIVPVVVLMGLLLAVLGLAWVFQRRLIYLPDARLLPEPESIIPGSRSVTLSTEDGLELEAWYVPRGSGAEAGQERADRSTAVIVFHGNAGNRYDRAPLAAALADQGFSVLLVDYRGYGRNPGAPTEEGLLLDARAAYRWCTTEESLRNHRLVYYGASLGSGVAIALAREHSPAAMVLRSPYTSMVDLARLHYPFLPAGLLLSDRFPSLGRIGEVRVPILFLVGERDSIIPPANSRRLFDAAEEPKTWLSLPEADHNDYDLLAGQRVIEAIVSVASRPREKG